MRVNNTEVRSMKQVLLLMGAWALLVMASCGNLQQRSSSQEAGIPTPDAGNVTITGQVISSSTGKPIGNTILRLAEVVRFGGEAAFILDETHGPATRTDESGRFAFVNVPAREYVLFLSAGENANFAVTEAPDRAKVWDARSGGVLDIGIVRVQWTQ
jgi:hypothetical protein